MKRTWLLFFSCLLGAIEARAQGTARLTPQQRVQLQGRVHTLQKELDSIKAKLGEGSDNAAVESASGGGLVTEDLEGKTVGAAALTGGPGVSPSLTQGLGLSPADAASLLKQLQQIKKNQEESEKMMLEIEKEIK